MNSANSTAQLLQQQGQATAGGQLASANALTSSLNNGLNMYGTAQGLGLTGGSSNTALPSGGVGSLAGNGYDANGISTSNYGLPTSVYGF
jgi:hypothetical protein